MKKTISIILLITLILSLTGCSTNKEPLSNDAFVSSMEKKGFDVLPIETGDVGGIDDANAGIVSTENGDYQIEFYDFATDEKAKAVFVASKEDCENAKSNSSSETTLSMGNNSRYTLSTGEYYYVVSRIDDTFVYVKADISCKDSVKDELKALGY